MPPRNASRCSKGCAADFQGHKQGECVLGYNQSDTYSISFFGFEFLTYVINIVRSPSTIADPMSRRLTCSQDINASNRRMNLSDADVMDL